MPDAHLGYAMPIGGVIATRDVVVPAWIGYDIGCGMCAVKTTFDAYAVKEHGKRIFDAVYRTVPVGFKHNKKPYMTRKLDGLPSSDWFKKMFQESGGFNQIGTLGGGNHFIEIGVGMDEHVWIIIHSGSRNVGHKTATFYMKEACYLVTGQRKAREWHYGFDQGAMDKVERRLALNYIQDMNVCLEFALENRRVIAERVEDAIWNAMGGVKGEILWDTLINRNHNHAEWRPMQQGTLWIHRKGATHAEKGMPGVIPGNMRDGSFIVTGRGNVSSLFSSSHGAGRVLGRKQAKETLKLEDFENTMGNVVAKVDVQTLDESPMAYKPVEQVMADQSDLVEIINRVIPIINIKS
jgi:tRNA-splicing ligase RtcB